MINTDPNHKHTYDEQGKMTCCSEEEKVYLNADATELIQPSHGTPMAAQAKTKSVYAEYIPAIISLVVLLVALLLDNIIKPDFFSGTVRVIAYLFAYMPVGIPVLKDTLKAFRKGEVFTEFFLMSLATIGAFILVEYPEAVAVMLFYAVGELFQSAAVNRAKKSIKALLDIRPDTATVLRNSRVQVKPEEVMIGETIQVKVGEKVALDGLLQTNSASFNTAALTGESTPKTFHEGEMVLAGMINLEKVVEIKVSKRFSDSSLAKILDMVQNANSRKAETELFIRKFSKIYTPAVVGLAALLVTIPYLVVEDYVFSEWLYRSLIFLVISCPCALVVSIPLGYFGGIGAASRNGILFKGSNYLDLITKVNIVVMDKTGTLTKGVFKVQQIVTNGIDEKEFLKLTAAIENQSTHPIAKAIVEYAGNLINNVNVSEIEEISGHGLKGSIDGKQVMAGNLKLLRKFKIEYDRNIETIFETIVVVAIDNKFAGYITIADEIKEDAPKAVEQMHELNIKTIMLSGDKTSVVARVAQILKIDSAFGDLLPENKVEKVEELKKQRENIIAFVGDGINDAPVLALSDVGIAMGGLGSDAAIETADVVIQTDQPSKIVTAIKIGKATKQIVWQNIALAFGVKVIVLALGAGGLANMWEAVFADVGVALLAILNAVRIQRKEF